MKHPKKKPVKHPTVYQSFNSNGFAFYKKGIWCFLGARNKNDYCKSVSAWGKFNVIALYRWKAIKWSKLQCEKACNEGI